MPDDHRRPHGHDDLLVELEHRVADFTDANSGGLQKIFDLAVAALDVPGADTRRRAVRALTSISDRISDWRSAVAEVLESGQQDFTTIRCTDWPDFTRVIEGF